mmetsp:Transcript_22607/g.46962  ORF Transcript_22607/g.46962 Transcript_22607/m.46962 type:complete len:303 (-) Transcript_22607:3255-4163(-)
MKLPPFLILGMVLFVPPPLSPTLIILAQLGNIPLTASVPLELLGGRARDFRILNPRRRMFSPTALAPSPGVLLAFRRTKLTTFPVMLSRPPRAPESIDCFVIKSPLTKLRTTPSSISNNPSPKLPITFFPPPTNSRSIAIGHTFLIRLTKDTRSSRHANFPPGSATALLMTIKVAQSSNTRTSFGFQSALPSTRLRALSLRLPSRSWSPLKLLKLSSATNAQISLSSDRRSGSPISATLFARSIKSSNPLLRAASNAAARDVHDAIRHSFENPLPLTKPSLRVSILSVIGRLAALVLLRALE